MVDKSRVAGKVKMRQKIISLFFSLLFAFLGTLFCPLPSSADDGVAGDRLPREYRLGEILIKGEKEKPQVYFIIPKAKFSLQNIPISDDIMGELSETEIGNDQSQHERYLER